MKATMSLYGLMQIDDTILDGMVFPDGVTEENQKIIKDSIIMESLELELLYSDPEMMKAAVSIWSNKRLWSWQKIFDANQLEYNPIWNKDGTVTEVHNLHGGYKDTHNLQLSNDNKVVTSGDPYTEETVAAFNSSDYENKNKVLNHLNSEIKTDGLSKDTGTLQHDTSDQGTIERIERGNIGVTTTQQMLKEEKEISDVMNLCEIITNEFISRFCLLVY